MKVHHLNCGTMYPLGSGVLVCHVLLVEADNGRVLIDTGFGTKDCDDPGQRVGPSRRIIRPVLDREEAAVNQVQRLGFRRDDVRHIVITHFDGDHIGGISDFPDAQIHVTATEAFGAMRAPSRGERIRFRPVLWAHGPTMVEHTADGEKWRGFVAAKALDEGPRRFRVRLPSGTRWSHSIGRCCSRTVLGSPSCIDAVSPTCSWSAHTTGLCTNKPKPPPREAAMHATSQTTVAAPIEIVWDTLSNHVGMSTWAPGLTVTMDKLGTPDPNGVGAVRRIASPGPGPDIVEEVVTFQAPHVLGYKALSGTPFPGYTGEVRLTPAGSGTHINYTISSTASFPLVKAPLAVVCQVLLRLLARASTKKN